MARRHGFSWTWIVTLAACGCSEGTVVNSGVGGNEDGGLPSDDGGRVVGPDGAISGSALSVGDPCDGTPNASCRPGLVCGSGGTCEFAHDKKEGEPCTAAGECETGLQCAAMPNPATGKLLSQCTAAGTGADGDGCQRDTDCQSGLRCGIVGFGSQCVPEGGADLGQTCSVSGDCFAGLLCAPPLAIGDAGAAPTSGTCAPVPASGPLAGLPFGIPSPPGITCDPVSQGKVKAYFEVPGADGTAADGDFFRLPFPNDARIKAGKIDLTGFPTPGSFLLGFDPVQTYVDAIETSEAGWGTYPTVLFRFSGPIDFNTFTAAGGEPSPVQFLDITDPANPGNSGAAWVSSPGGGKYICHDWLGIRRPQGAPLEPQHTYTVYVTTVGRDKNGLAIERSPQLAALLGATKPTDAGLASAYAAYKPFRDYLAAQAIDESTILNATVITTSPVRDSMTALAAAANAAAVPTASGWVKCGGGAVSPCPQAEGDRACGAVSADYDEYHALVKLPIFQKGTAPYIAAGGGIDTTSPVRSEDVCMALTVPRAGVMPASGWPLVVFGHGTGGSFRSHIRAEVSGALAKATTPSAVLGYDAVQHGPRRGSSTASPNVLFFNFKNPDAARGNPLQGAADVISIGRFAKLLTIPAAITGAGALTIDPNAIAYFGHSQGSMHGSLGLPFTNDYTAAVLSGNGASLMHALLTKTKPQNIAAAIPFALGGDYDPGSKTPKLFGGDSHPVLDLLQQWIDPADPLNFARAIARDTPTGILPKSIFQTYGIGDTYSPPVTMETYAIAADLPVAASDPSVSKPDVIADFAEQPVPLNSTFAANGKTVTLGLREYQNASGKDGHFVVFDVPSANADVVRFLSMALGGQVPDIGK